MAHQSSPDVPEFPSSPPTSQQHRISKPRRPPTVTPKRFNRFFNPGSSSSVSGKSGRSLRDLTRSGVNRVNGPHDTGDETRSTVRPGKRQKCSSLDQENLSSDIIFPSSPPVTSPCQKYNLLRDQLYPRPIARSKPPRPTWQPACYTLDFCSEPDERHSFADSSYHLPYCTTACNTNSLVAVGYQEGQVRILESAKDSTPGFDKPYVSFKPHEDAIIDLAFSSDDKWLTTAAVDQSAKVIDMQTQKPVYVLDRHTASLKQVAFQPSNDQIIATCSRDNTIALWDLRCAKGSPAVRTRLRDKRQENLQPQYPRIYKSFAHGPSRPPTQRVKTVTSSADQLYRQIPYQPVVTALSFVPNSPHLFITAEDSTSHLTVWDIRSRIRAGGTSDPVLIYDPPKRHRVTRNYGITSLSFSTDAARLYAVCRDDRVHAYSTAHLILGQTATRPRDGMDGDVLSHEQLSVSSFYTRSRMRPASATHPELLAVGSSNGTVVLFPTGYSAPKVKSWTGDASDHVCYDATKVSGTALRGGHTREVTGLAWTSEGELVSCADDYTARVWREDRERARNLRSATEQQRWMCGWSETEAQWDWDKDEAAGDAE